MSPPEVWGPPIWTLFHVLAEKINEHMYPFYAGQLFNIVKQICSALPCPECTNDATIVLSKIKIQDLKTKEDFKKMIYIFHNYVNAKKRKPLYFAFLDQDMFLYKPFTIISFLDNHGLWGDVAEVDNQKSPSLNINDVNDGPWILHPWLSFFKFE